MQWGFGLVFGDLTAFGAAEHNAPRAVFGSANRLQLGNAMNQIKKKIVTDEQMRPIAVQIDYESWLEIERRLGMQTSGTPEKKSLDQILEKSKGIWTEGDGLEYQRRIRDEWTRPWDPEAEDKT